MQATIGKRLKDGKYPVAFHFSGGPNAFGGNYPGKTINKIMTEEAIRDSMKTSPGAYSAYQLKQWGEKCTTST